MKEGPVKYTAYWLVDRIGDCFMSVFFLLAFALLFVFFPFHWSFVRFMRIVAKDVVRPGYGP